MHDATLRDTATDLQTACTVQMNVESCTCTDKPIYKKGICMPQSCHIHILVTLLQVCGSCHTLSTAQELVQTQATHGKPMPKSQF
jgi:hypothetical protein